MFHFPNYHVPCLCLSQRLVSSARFPQTLQMAVDTEKDSQQDQPRRHKIPVPSNYRTASKILRRVVEERCNVKTLILEEKHIRKGKGLAIMDLILVNLKQIDELLKRTNLLTKEPRLNPWLAKVLIAELIFGRGELNGDSLPVQCIKRYKEELQATLGELDVAPTKQLDFKGNCCVSIDLRGVFSLSLPGNDGKEK